MKPIGKKRPDSGQLRSMEFRTDVRGMGLRFTEKIRDAWRGRWLKLR